MKSLFSPVLLCLGASLLLLPGCGIYFPHMPATPVLSAGQLEAKVAVAPFMSLSTATVKPMPRRWVPATEGYVAFSPVKHLFGLVAAGTNFIGPLQTDVVKYNHERQADIGIGYYRRLGAQQKCYVAGSMGVG